MPRASCSSARDGEIDEPVEAEWHAQAAPTHPVDVLFDHRALGDDVGVEEDEDRTRRTRCGEISCSACPETRRVLTDDSELVRHGSRIEAERWVGAIIGHHDFDPRHRVRLQCEHGERPHDRSASVSGWDANGHLGVSEGSSDRGEQIPAIAGDQTRDPIADDAFSHRRTLRRQDRVRFAARRSDG